MQPGGQLTETTDVDNFPGYAEGINGTAMMVDLENQAKRFDTDVRTGWVTKVDFSGDKKLVEIEEGKDTSLVETILYPTHRQQVNYLRGVTLGVASQPRLTPYSSKTIWRRVPDRITAREALQDCGISDISSRKVGHTIREYLGAET